MNKRTGYRMLREAPFEHTKRKPEPPPGLNTPEDARWKAAKRSVRRIKRTNAALEVLLCLLTAVLLALAFAGAAHGETYTVCTGGAPLNIRANPWIGAEDLGDLYNGDTVNVVSQESGWAYVQAPVEAGGG